MVKEDYEILPHKLLSDLKDEVESLKKKLTEPDKKSEELILEIESLKDSVGELNEIFKRTLDEIKGNDSVSKDIKNIVSQNEIIAKGMVAISDKLEDFMDKFGQVSPPLVRSPPPMPRFNPPTPQHIMGNPSMPGSRMAPPPQMELPPIPQGLPSFGNNSDEVDYVPPPPPNRSPQGKRTFSLFK